MKKILQIVGILIVLSCGVFAQQKSWKTFSPNDGAWSILAPGIMIPDSKALESPSTVGSYSYSDAKVFFSVIYRDTPKSRLLLGFSKESHIKKVRDNFVKTNKGQLIKDVEFSNGMGNGREVYVKIAEGNVIGGESQIDMKYRIHRMRLFFNKRRFYILLAVLPEKEIDSAEVNNFFNSFVIK